MPTTWESGPTGHGTHCHRAPAWALAVPYLTSQKSLDAALMRAGHHHTGTISVFVFLQRKRKWVKCGPAVHPSQCPPALQYRHKGNCIHHYPITLIRLWLSRTLWHQVRSDSKGTCGVHCWWYPNASCLHSRFQVKGPMDNVGLVKCPCSDFSLAFQFGVWTILKVAWSPGYCPKILPALSLVHKNG